MTMLRATHLATVKSAIYDQRWEEFHVKRPARIVAVRPCLTGVSMRSAEIIDISQGGATFIVSTTAGLPKHYYLNILGLATGSDVRRSIATRNASACGSST